MDNIGKIIVAAGIAVIAIGLIIWFFGNRFTWFGNLPGDIKVEKENFKFYAPIATMLLISVLLTLALWLIRKFFNH